MVLHWSFNYAPENLLIIFVCIGLVVWGNNLRKKKNGG